MEQVVARGNMWAALRRVEQNKGAPGVDGMRVENLREHLKATWETTRATLINGVYEPKPVRRVENPEVANGFWASRPSLIA